MVSPKAMCPYMTVSLYSRDFHLKTDIRCPSLSPYFMAETPTLEQYWITVLLSQAQSPTTPLFKTTACNLYLDYKVCPFIFTSRRWVHISIHLHQKLVTDWGGLTRRFRYKLYLQAYGCHQSEDNAPLYTSVQRLPPQ